MHPEARELLQAYPWPGNVRELKNLMERLVLLSGTSNTIEIKHIPSEILAGMSSGLHTHDHTRPAKLADVLRVLEKTMVCEALTRAKWNKTQASKELGISRASLNNKIAEFNIQSNPTLSG